MKNTEYKTDGTHEPEKSARRTEVVITLIDDDYSVKTVKNGSPGWCSYDSLSDLLEDVTQDLLDHEAAAGDINEHRFVKVERRDS